MEDPFYKVHVNSPRSMLIFIVLFIVVATVWGTTAFLFVALLAAAFVAILTTALASAAPSPNRVG